MDLAEAVYELTKDFPPEEKFNLVSQLRRSAISIPSNIAEGRHRSTRKDFIHFLYIAYSSSTELETQLELSSRLVYGDKEKHKKIHELLGEVMKMLNSMIKKLKS